MLGMTRYYLRVGAYDSRLVPLSGGTACVV